MYHDRTNKIQFPSLLKGKDDLLVCSACQTVTYCDISCQEADWNKHKKICKKLKNIHDAIASGDETKLIDDFDRRNTTAEIIKSSLGLSNKSKRLKVAVPVSGDDKGKKVHIKSQPEFAPSQDNFKMNNNLIGVKNQETKSILKSVAVKVSLDAPTIKPLENHVQAITPGSQEERFDRLLVSPNPTKAESSTSSQSGTNLLKKLTTPTGRKEESKIPDEQFDQLLDELHKIHSSPSDGRNDQVEVTINVNETSDDEAAEQNLETPSCSLTTTPINSPRLTSQVNSISAQRTSSRMKQRRCTPYPSTAAVREMCNMYMKEMEIPVRRKIEFQPEDKVDEDSSMDVGSNPNVASESPSTPVRRKIDFQTEDVIDLDSSMDVGSKPIVASESPIIPVRRKIDFHTEDDVDLDSSMDEGSNLNVASESKSTPVSRKIDFQADDEVDLDSSMDEGSNQNVVSESPSAEMTSSGLVSVSTGDISLYETIQVMVALIALSTILIYIYMRYILRIMIK